MVVTCPACGAELSADAPQGLCPRCLLRSSPATADYAAFTPPAPTDLAPLFPQLEIVELLGAGGMGAVYKARQPGLDRLVALKVLPRRDDPAFAERFTREARTLAKLNHPGIVTVYDFGTADGLHYILMEHVEGVTLRQAEHSGNLTAAEALAIVPQICAALQFAHEAGVVHRDIKPENILLDAKGRVKVADFGLAKLLSESGPQPLTHTHQVMGTVHYMAPEQWEKPAAVDHRADIYSLGVVFYELLTGELPLGRFPPPSEKVQIDVRLDEVVLRTLEKEPARRYQHASDLKTDVDRIRDTPSGPAQQPVDPANASPPDDPSKGQRPAKALGWALGRLGQTRSVAGAFIVLSIVLLGFAISIYMEDIFWLGGRSAAPGERQPIQEMLIGTWDGPGRRLDFRADGSFEDSTRRRKLTGEFRWVAADRLEVTVTGRAAWRPRIATGRDRLIMWEEDGAELRLRRQMLGGASATAKAAGFVSAPPA